MVVSLATILFAFRLTLKKLLNVHVAMHSRDPGCLMGIETFLSLWARRVLEVFEVLPCECINGDIFSVPAGMYETSLQLHLLMIMTIIRFVLISGELMKIPVPLCNVPFEPYQIVSKSSSLATSNNNRLSDFHALWIWKE